MFNFLIFCSSLLCQIFDIRHHRSILSQHFWWSEYCFKNIWNKAKLVIFYCCVMWYFQKKKIFIKTRFLSTRDFYENKLKAFLFWFWFWFWFWSSTIQMFVEFFRNDSKITQQKTIQNDNLSLKSTLMNSSTIRFVNSRSIFEKKINRNEIIEKWSINMSNDEKTFFMSMWFISLCYVLCVVLFFLQQCFFYLRILLKRHNCIFFDTKTCDM